MANQQHSNLGKSSHAAIHAILGQWRAVYAVVVILLIAGAFAVAAMPEQVYPTFSIPRVLVVAENDDLAPPLVQTSITRPLEQQLDSVLGVQQVVANSSQGASAITTTFDPKVTEINVALQRVSDAVATIQSQLPLGTTVSIQQVDPNLFPVIGYALTSKRLTQMQLREIALYQIRPSLIGLSGVSAVSVLGGDVREYLVSIDPSKLTAHGVTVQEVEAAIARANVVSGVGHTDNGYIRSTILATGQAHSPGDIAAIPVTAVGDVPITVGMLAAVVEAPAPPTWASIAQGKPSVIVNINAQPGANFVDVARSVTEAMHQATGDLAGVAASQFWNQASLVTEAIGSLRDAILVGLVLSTIVLYFFLRNWASTLIAALVIPITLIITFGLMAILREGLNLMTLGGLAVGVGLIVDDAIVVVENINRRLDLGERRATAIASAVAEIATPMISSTLTTIVVFAPLGLLSGLVGAFFRAMAVTLALALLISLALAFVFVPNMALRFIRIRGDVPTNPLVAWVRRRYEPLLRIALSRRATILGAGAALLAATALIGTFLGTDFLPRLDEGAFETEFRLPPGTTLEETTAVARRMDGIVRADPAVASDAVVVGLTMSLFDKTRGANTGILRATLKARSGRPPTTQVIDRIQNRIVAMAPNAQLSTKQVLADMLDDLSSAPAPIEIRVYGSDQSLLVPIADDIADRIATVPGVSGAFGGAVFHDPSVVAFARPESRVFGVAPADLAQDEAVALGGDVVSTVIHNPLLIPVRVRYDLPADPTMDQVRNIPIVTSSGGVQPLSRLATLKSTPPQSEINEINGRQYLAVTAQLGGSHLGAVVAGIKRQLQQVALPPGYLTEVAGAYALQRQSFLQFTLAIGLSVALVFLVMLVQFRSFSQPLSIILSVPLALFGVVVALAITGISLNVSSLMGVILLVGLVVKNGILLLEYAARRQRAGDTIADALAFAAQARLRPILMTTLTALLGMLPLAFALGSGSELLQPLAVAVIGGLSCSTIVTLILIPVVYTSLSERLDKSRASGDDLSESEELADV